MKNLWRMACLALVLLSLSVWSSSVLALTITPNFDANFITNFGANAPAAEAAWNAAAAIFTSNFRDNIHINITVDGSAGTSTFGASSTSTVTTTYANLLSKVIADAKTPDDAIAIGAGGSMTATDPAGGTGTWRVSRSEAKALGLIADDLSNDGTTYFGAGNPFTFSGTVTSGHYDFKAVAAHEISEVMGRFGYKSTSSRMLLDAFSFTGVGARDMVGGPNNNFSINDGTTLLKLWNDPTTNSLDSRDWATNGLDAFNQYLSGGASVPVSTTDLRLLDVIGYDRILSVPEPSSFVLAGMATLGLLAAIRQRRRVRSVVDVC